MIENYVAYLKYLQERLDRFFASQKEYIACKKGCAKCCKNAQFPYSLIEFKYLLQGFLTLDKETQDKVEANISKIYQDKKLFKGEKFLYDCPFLIDEACCVYDYRGIVCRSFGLITAARENKNAKIPFCAFIGLNYSNVLDDEKKKLSGEKVEKLGLKEEPLGFNIGYDFLTNKDFERGFNFSFGDKKALIDWFDKDLTQQN